MSRGGILLAVALTLALSPAAAAGQSAAQPDLVIVGRHGTGLTGDDIYDSHGIGEQRSVIVDKTTVLVVRLENDGSARAEFVLNGTTAHAGITIRYFRGRRDVTQRMAVTGLRLHLDPGASKDLRAVVTADPEAPLGTIQAISIIAKSTESVRTLDAIRAEVTKTSTPE